MTIGLRDQALKASTWVFAGNIGSQVVGFAISVILARLLEPAQFGLIAMLSIFMAIASSLVNSGFGSALIRKQNATRVDESSIFYFNIVIAVVMYAILWCCAPFIARFYHQPILQGLSRIVGLNFIIDAFGLIQSNLLRKELNFRIITIATFIGGVTSGIVGITLAYAGFGVWSLAIQGMISTLLITSLLWYFHPWRPVAQVSLSSLRSMFSYGSRLLLSGLLDTTYNNIYPMLIGRLYSKADTGYYARANSASSMPISSFAGVMGQVAFPLFSKLQADPAALKAGYQRMIKLAAFIYCPIMLGLIAMAKPLFLLLFTSKWLPAVPFFQLLCLAGILYPLHMLNLNALMVVGRSDLFLRLEVFKKIIGISILVLTCKFGIIAMIYGSLFGSMICLVLNTHYSARFLNYPLYRQLADLIPYLLISAVMFCGMYAIYFCLGRFLIICLLLEAAVGIVVYFTLTKLFALSAFHEVRDIYLEKIRPSFRTRSTYV